MGCGIDLGVWGFGHRPVANNQRERGRVKKLIGVALLSEFYYFNDTLTP
jgi:hypothetical protein